MHLARIKRLDPTYKTAYGAACRDINNLISRRVCAILMPWQVTSRLTVRRVAGKLRRDRTPKPGHPREERVQCRDMQHDSGNIKEVRIRACRAGNWTLRNRSLTAGLAAGDPIEQLHPQSQLVHLGPGSFALHVHWRHTSPSISFRPAADLPAHRVVWVRS